MGPQKYLFLHKNEWNRIKMQCKPCEEPTINKEHIQRMQELSQEWIKSWPDTVKGHIEMLKKIEARKRKKDLEEIKKFASQKKQDDFADAIQKAKREIFEDSCYGKQLISCLIGSKTLEEREAQLKFQNKIKDRLVVDEKEMILKEKQRNCELENKKLNKLREKQKKDREIAELNKTMYETRNKNVVRDREIQKQTELEDMNIIKKLLENETMNRIKHKIDENKQLLRDNIKHIEYKKELEERRKKEQETNERINRVWHEYYDRVRRKKNVVHEEVKKKDVCKKMKVFQNLEQIKKTQENKYNDFVDKGIKRFEQKLNEENKFKETQKINNKICPVRSITDYGTSQTKRNKEVCHCDRQTFTCRPSKKNCNPISKDLKKDEFFEFLEPSKNLADELKTREKEPFPWSGTKAAHEQFAQEANKILGECRFKAMARKVVDDYIRINRLDSNSLPIRNYL